MHNCIYFGSKSESINKLHLFPDQEELDKIGELLDSLNIVRAGTIDLQGNDKNLADADEVRRIIVSFSFD